MCSIAAVAMLCGPLAAPPPNIVFVLADDLGYGEVTAVDPSRAGAADISYVGDHVDMAIDGMGMGGANDHTVNETGDLESMRVQAQRAAILMYRLVHGGL